MATQQYKSVRTTAITSRKLGASEHVEERLFWRIHFASDSYGTVSGDPWDILHAAVPGVRGFDIDIVTDTIDALVNRGALERWTEDDGTTWLHVVNHDQLQSGYFRSKRGRRLSPVPPSQRREPSDTPPEVPSPERGGDRRSEAERGGDTRRVPHQEPNSPARSSSIRQGVGEGEEALLQGAVLGPLPHHVRHIPEGSAMLALHGSNLQLLDRERRITALAGPFTRSDANGRALPAAAHPRRHPQDTAVDGERGAVAS